jgi:hypothetical protein
MQRNARDLDAIEKALESASEEERKTLEQRKKVLIEWSSNISKESALADKKAQDAVAAQRAADSLTSGGSGRSISDFKFEPMGAALSAEMSAISSDFMPQWGKDFAKAALSEMGFTSKLPDEDPGDIDYELLRKQKLEEMDASKLDMGNALGGLTGTGDLAGIDPMTVMAEHISKFTQPFKDGYADAIDEVAQYMTDTLWDPAERKALDFAEMMERIGKDITKKLMAAGIDLAVKALIPGGMIMSGFGGGGMFHDGGPIPRMHSGGLRPDERHIIAQSGEYMVKAPSVRALGVPTMDYINETGSLPTGVSVSPTFNVYAIDGASVRRVAPQMATEIAVLVSQNATRFDKKALAY